MEKVKLGLIGCGWAVNDLYAPAFQFLEKGELVAVMDIKEERAKHVQERFKVPRRYTRLDDIVNDKDVKAVMVLTPPHHHCEPVVAAAKAGKHVYCEKPMAPTIEEADAMIAACSDAMDARTSSGIRSGVRVKFMIAFMKRFNRSFRQVKTLLEEGRLGEVFELRARWDNARVGGPRRNSTA